MPQVSEEKKIIVMSYRGLPWQRLVFDSSVRDEDVIIYRVRVKTPKPFRQALESNVGNTRSSKLTLDIA